MSFLMDYELHHLCPWTKKIHDEMETDAVRCVWCAMYCELDQLYEALEVGMRELKQGLLTMLPKTVGQLGWDRYE